MVPPDLPRPSLFPTFLPFLSSDPSPPLPLFRRSISTTPSPPATQPSSSPRPSLTPSTLSLSNPPRGVRLSSPMGTARGVCCMRGVRSGREGRSMSLGVRLAFPFSPFSPSRYFFGRCGFDGRRGTDDPSVSFREQPRSCTNPLHTTASRLFSTSGLASEASRGRRTRISSLEGEKQGGGRGGWTAVYIRERGVVPCIFSLFIVRPQNSREGERRYSTIHTLSTTLPYALLTFSSPPSSCSSASPPTPTLTARSQPSQPPAASQALLDWRRRRRGEER